MNVSNISIEATTPEQNQFVEPICDENLHNSAIFVSSDKALVELYEKAVGAFWSHTEVSASKDKEHFHSLTPDEKIMVKNVVAFFASADQLVQMNIATRFMSDIKHMDALNFLSYQIFNESIHAIVYSNFLHAFLPSQEIPDYISSLGMLPGVIAKRDFVNHYATSDKSFVTRLLAFAMVEHIFFSSSFATIFYLKSQRKMPELCLSNNFIARDEASHVEFAIHIYNNHIVNKLNTTDFYTMLNSAVIIEKQFALEAIPQFIGFDGELMSQYIDYVANWLCVRLNYPPMNPGVTNPFEFMQTIHMEVKSNFFEKTGSAYSATSGAKTPFVHPKKRKALEVDA